MSSIASAHSAKEVPPAERPQPVATVDEDTEKNFRPKSFTFWTIIIGIYLSIFLVALDRTIIATAIPRITDEFNSIQDIGWYGSAYMLTAACFNPISGRVYQLYSTKWVFLLSIVIFEAGSSLAALSLIMCHGDGASTSTCRLVALQLLAVVLFLHIESPKHEKLTIIAQIKRVDPIGIFFFIPSMVCLILALQWGGSTYSWSAPKIIALLVTFSVLFIAFVVVEVLMPEDAMAPTRVILNRSIAGSMTFMFLLSGGSMSVVYYLTVWFQAVKGDSAMHAGVSTIPLILSLVIMSIVAAICTEKIGYYVPAMLLSPVLCSIGASLLSTLSPSGVKSAPDPLLLETRVMLPGAHLRLARPRRGAPIHNDQKSVLPSSYSAVMAGLKTLRLGNPRHGERDTLRK
ncbi:uncharacterized protein Z518_11282 [Rhinocladiella mackenziei CBS 650.93]|uniref:Major facilitator superfamily (MFS) profile domain-containing protein n=1 Tax=Rhinocladiella mackenziei CBS 650.93 TaxID=1442369 RepID=A0A0D2I1F8_9EURO|nr:uncharacterized protein Z518_11282 [Rhinocladiella mackenziei CBS 650.93]KIW99543.1 hypothetical protein Z518_11282 [Rhinocladiella mackenziei CBS 650.93]